jgi:hypothetical protein
MAYYIQNPALLGLQEGNANARADRNIYGEMMANYLTNAAAYGRQLAQDAAQLAKVKALAAQGLTAAGTPFGSQQEKDKILAGLTSDYARYENLFGEEGKGMPGGFADFFRVARFLNKTGQLNPQTGSTSDGTNP